MQHKGCPPGHVVKHTVITSNLHVHVRLLTPSNHNMYRLIKYVQEKYSFYMYTCTCIHVKCTCTTIDNVYAYKVDDLLHVYM